MTASPLPRRELDFTDAMEAVVSGKCISRPSWDGYPAVYYFLKDEYVHIHWPNGREEKAVFCTVDISATDYVVVEPETVQ